VGSCPDARNKEISPKLLKKVVLDGQQRITTGSFNIHTKYIFEMIRMDPMIKGIRFNIL